MGNFGRTFIAHHFDMYVLKLSALCLVEYLKRNNAYPSMEIMPRRNMKCLPLLIITIYMHDADDRRRQILS